MFKLETEVFQLRLDLVETQAVSQGGVDIKRLASNLILFVGRLRVECPHIVQTVGNLDEDDADVVAHRQQQLLEVLGLGRGLLAKDATADFRQTVNDLCYLSSEEILDVLDSILCILDHVV